MTGQWQKFNTLDTEALAVFEASYPKKIGVSYKVIAPYYKQIVAGTNYIFTVEAIISSPTAQPSIKYLQTFQSLPHEGAKVAPAQVLDQLPLHVDFSLDFFLDQRLPIGGWQLHTELDAEALKVFEAAKPKRLGYEYTALAPYYTQVVNGVNYVFASVGHPVVAHSESLSAAFLRTYRSNDGKVESGIIIGSNNIENVA